MQSTRLNPIFLEIEDDTPRNRWRYVGKITWHMSLYLIFYKGINLKSKGKTYRAVSRKNSANYKRVGTRGRASHASG